MLFLPSGINDAATARMAATVSQYALSDPTDLPNLKPHWPNHHIALDSGGYALFKAGQAITTEQLTIYLARTLHEYAFLFELALDQIGDYDRTLELYRACHNTGFRRVPIYQWGAPRAHLDEYMQTASMVNLPNGCVPLVAIGGMAKIFRGGKGEKDPTRKRQLDDACKHALDELEKLCTEFPTTFHILGLNNLDGIMRLRHLVPSCDSSKWLDGGRYGQIFFTNTRTGKFQAAPALRIPEYAHLDRTQRCIHNLTVLIERSAAP